MESSLWPESLPSKRIKAIQHLTQGQQLTNKLREMLEHPEKFASNRRSVDDVLLEISGMFDSTLSIIRSCTFNEIPCITGDDHMRSLSNSDCQKEEHTDENDQTLKPLKPKRGCHKRRKNAWTSTKVASTLVDDGYGWRKYGQKMILNTKHRRNYYRCTHKFDQGCRATKQVQKTEDEPPKYKIIYDGQHTCKNLLKFPQITLDSSNRKDNSVLLNFAIEGFNSNKQVDLSLGLRHKQVSSLNNCLSRNLTKQVTQVLSKPRSMMSFGLDHEEMISLGVYSSP